MRIRLIVAVAATVLTVGLSSGRAQQQVRDSIKVIARSHKDSVVLRWAPSSPTSWKLLNTHGYRVERYTITRDGKVLQTKERKVLADLIKPAPQAQWERWIDHDDMVAIAAQSLFGERFELNMKQADAMSVYTKVREDESRYSFALYAADLSIRAARLSGVGFTDATVAPNETYLYRVYSRVPDTALPIQFGFAYAGPSEARALPVPRKPEVENTSETSVLLRWETYALRDAYIGYYLERSDNNGASFARINKVPMSVLQSKLGADGKMYSSRKDTLIVGRNAQYRVRGMNSFGEVGPPSEALTFTGEAKFDATPTLVKATVVENARVHLFWEFPGDVDGMKSFEIERSGKVDRDFKAISKDLPASQREYIDLKPAGTNYYRVVAVSQKGTRMESFPYLVQLTDSIPPAAPAGLQVAVDSTGIVTLQWAKNTELDLLGYRVFRSSFKNSEFGQVTVSPLRTTTTKDTVNIKTLTSKVYYKIAAVDNRFNTSAFSAVVELVLPDVVPPVPPVLTGVKPREGGVELTWHNSSSEDVKEHRIYRKHQFATTWALLKVVGPTDSCCYYFDKVSDEHQYQYALQAVDKSSLTSVMTKPVWGRALKQLVKPPVTGVLAVPDRVTKAVRLTWRHEAKGVTKYLVYRSRDTDALALYKALPASAGGFEDKGVDMNTGYTYRVKAIFRDGTESAFSDAVQIQY